MVSDENIQSICGGQVEKNIIDRLHQQYAMLNGNLNKNLQYLIGSIILFELIRAGGLKIIEFQNIKIEFKLYASLYPLIYGFLYYLYARSYYRSLIVFHSIFSIYRTNFPGIPPLISSIIVDPEIKEYKLVCSNMIDKSKNYIFQISNRNIILHYIFSLYFVINILVIAPSYYYSSGYYECDWGKMYQGGRLFFIYSASWFLCEFDNIKRYFALISAIVGTGFIIRAFLLIRRSNVIINLDNTALNRDISSQGTEP